MIFIRTFSGIDNCLAQKNFFCFSFTFILLKVFLYLLFFPLFYFEAGLAYKWFWPSCSITYYGWAVFPGFDELSAAFSSFFFGPAGKILIWQLGLWLVAMAWKSILWESKLYSSSRHNLGYLNVYDILFETWNNCVIFLL